MGLTFAEASSLKDAIAVRFICIVTHRFSRFAYGFGRAWLKSYSFLMAMPLHVTAPLWLCCLTGRDDPNGVRCDRARGTTTRIPGAGSGPTGIEPGLLVPVVRIVHQERQVVQEDGLSLFVRDPWLSYIGGRLGGLRLELDVLGDQPPHKYALVVTSGKRSPRRPNVRRSPAPAHDRVGRRRVQRLAWISTGDYSPRSARVSLQATVKS